LLKGSQKENNELLFSYFSATFGYQMVAGGGETSLAKLRTPLEKVLPLWEKHDFLHLPPQDLHFPFEQLDSSLLRENCRKIKNSPSKTMRGGTWVNNAKGRHPFNFLIISLYRADTSAQKSTFFRIQMQSS
jgi:hypothetical protein